MIQETLEEAAEKYNSQFVSQNEFAIEDFINGAKWQAERMYNEKDLFKIIFDFVAFPHSHMESRGSIIERYLKELKNK
jgi:hypothetical protein